VRYYDPEIGKWISTDPAKEFWDSYRYTTNPIAFIDPNGEYELVASSYNGVPGVRIQTISRGDAIANAIIKTVGSNALPTGFLFEIAQNMIEKQGQTITLTKEGAKQAVNLATKEGVDLYPKLSGKIFGRLMVVADFVQNLTSELSKADSPEFIAEFENRGLTHLEQFSKEQAFDIIHDINETISTENKP